jgi:hypothetical protein
MKKKPTRRPPRPEIEHEELLERTSEAVQACGVEMQTQAQFSYAIAKEVIGSRDFRLISMQPQIKIRTDAAWCRAYELAIRFLQQYDMKTSLSTVEKEFRGASMPRETEFLRKQDASGYMDQMLTRIEPESFTTQMEYFAQVKRAPPRSKSPTALVSPGNRLREQRQLSQSRGSAARSQSTPKKPTKK